MPGSHSWLWLYANNGQARNTTRPGDVIVVEDGASSAGMGRLTLPAARTYITGAFVWCSIGYATPALLVDWRSDRALPAVSLSVVARWR